jgi:hypothetical protein
LPCEQKIKKELFNRKFLLDGLYFRVNNKNMTNLISLRINNDQKMKDKKTEWGPRFFRFLAARLRMI